MDQVSATVSATVSNMTNEVAAGLTPLLEFFRGNSATSATGSTSASTSGSAASTSTQAQGQDTQQLPLQQPPQQERQSAESFWAGEAESGGYAAAAAAIQPAQPAGDPSSYRQNTFFVEHVNPPSAPPPASSTSTRRSGDSAGGGGGAGRGGGGGGGAGGSRSTRGSSGRSSRRSRARDRPQRVDVLAEQARQTGSQNADGGFGGGTSTSTSAISSGSSSGGGGGGSSRGVAPVASSAGPTGNADWQPVVPVPTFITVDPNEATGHDIEDAISRAVLRGERPGSDQLAGDGYGHDESAYGSSGESGERGEGGSGPGREATVGAGGDGGNASGYAANAYYNGSQSQRYDPVASRRARHERTHGGLTIPSWRSYVEPEEEEEEGDHRLFGAGRTATGGGGGGGGGTVDDDVDAWEGAWSEVHDEFGAPIALRSSPSGGQLPGQSFEQFLAAALAVPEGTVAPAHLPSSFSSTTATATTEPAAPVVDPIFSDDKGTLEFDCSVVSMFVAMGMDPSVVLVEYYTALKQQQQERRKAGGDNSTGSGGGVDLDGMAERVFAAQEAAAAAAEEVADGNACVICLCEPKTIACVPCGHLSMCAGCSQLSTSSACPVCRAYVERKQKIFV